jgi:hypothetical protein
MRSASDKAEIDNVFHMLNSECGKVWYVIESSLARERLLDIRRDSQELVSLSARLGLGLGWLKDERQKKISPL